MMTVHEVSRLTGVSIRALQYYDRIGLLHPAGHTDAGYRLYDDAAMEILQQILLFRELEFPLKEIRRIIQSPSFDRQKALEQQITLLELKKEHLDNLIHLACEIIATGGKTNMDFSAFDTKKMDEYTARAKEAWGETSAWQEYQQKIKGKPDTEMMAVNRQMMDIFAEFGAIRNQEATSAEAQGLVRKLQEFISEHYYRCTDRILSGLGQMYAAGGEMTDNIDSYGGKGTALFASEAIRVFCTGKNAD